MSSTISKQLKEIKYLIYEKGEYKKARKALETIEKNKGITEEKSLMILILKCQIFTKQGNFNESLQLSDEVIKKAEELNNNNLLLDALIERMEAFWRVGEIHSGMKVVTRAEMIIEKLHKKHKKDIQEKIGMVTTWKAANYWSLLDYDQALSLAQKSLTFFEISKRKIYIGNANLLIGTLYSGKGDFDIAISYIEQSIKDFEEIGNKRQIAVALNNQGGNYEKKGNYKRGLIFYERSLKLRASIGNKQDIAITLAQIADIKIIISEYKQALGYLKQVIVLLEEIGDTKYIHGYLREIGNVYHNLGNKKLALDNLLRSLKLATQTEDHWSTAQTLYNLIIKYLEYGEEKQARSYFDHLHKINNQIHHYQINNAYHLSKVLLLKTKADARSRGKAEGILEYLISSRRITFKTRILALLSLCELLLVEFHNTGKEEIFDDLSEKIDYLVEITYSNQSLILLIEGYRLKSLLNLIKLDVPKSKQILEKALAIAKEKELENLVVDIQKDLQQISEKKSLWDKLKKDQKSLVEIMKQTPLMNSMKRLAKEKILNIEKRDTESGKIIEYRKLFALKI